MPEALRGGTLTRWQVMGDGPEPALVLHCGLGRGSMWRGVAQGLGDLLTMTVPDLPGHGRSGPWDWVRSVHDQASDMARSFVDRPMHLVGHSFGGTIALRLAVEAPEMVLSLTLVEPVLFAAAAHRPIYAQSRAQEDDFTRVFRDGDAMGAARLFNRRWGDGQTWDSFTPQSREMMAANMRFIIGESQPALWDDVCGILAPGGLESIAAPVTVLRGADSLSIVPAVHDALVARLPHGRDVAVDGARHMVVVSHPDAVATAVRDTMARRALA